MHFVFFAVSLKEAAWKEIKVRICEEWTWNNVIVAYTFDECLQKFPALQIHASPCLGQVYHVGDFPACFTILSSYIKLHLQPVVLFAGEHTHSSFYSTVHGAYLTGRSAAQVLLSYQSPQELVMECQGTSDLSSWIQGISLDWSSEHEMKCGWSSKAESLTSTVWLQL